MQRAPKGRQVEIAIDGRVTTLATIGELDDALVAHPTRSGDGSAQGTNVAGADMEAIISPNLARLARVRNTHQSWQS
jgi:hypothetical protein